MAKDSFLDAMTFDKPSNYHCSACGSDNENRHILVHAAGRGPKSAGVTDPMLRFIIKHNGGQSLHSERFGTAEMGAGAAIGERYYKHGDAIYLIPRDFTLNEAQ